MNTLNIENLTANVENVRDLKGVPSKELVDILTKIRKHYGQPVINQLRV